MDADYLFCPVGIIITHLSSDYSIFCLITIFLTAGNLPAVFYANFFVVDIYSIATPSLVSNTTLLP